MENYSSRWKQRMKSIWSRRSCALVDSNLRLTLYSSYGSKKPKNWEEDARDHGGDADPCPKAPQSRAMSNRSLLLIPGCYSRYLLFGWWGGSVFRFGDGVCMWVQRCAHVESRAGPLMSYSYFERGLITEQKITDWTKLVDPAHWIYLSLHYVVRVMGTHSLSIPDFCYTGTGIQTHIFMRAEQALLTPEPSSHSWT